jgi:hypothetical protein
MSLYFSVAMWSILALCSFGLVEERLPQYRTRWGIPSRTIHRLSVRVSAGRPF